MVRIVIVFKVRASSRDLVARSIIILLSLCARRAISVDIELLVLSAARARNAMIFCI